MGGTAGKHGRNGWLRTPFSADFMAHSISDGAHVCRPYPQIKAAERVLFTKLFVPLQAENKH